MEREIDVYLIERGEIMAEILRWDTARYLNTEEDIEGYLDIIYEDGDGDLIALGEWNAERARRRLLRQQKHRDRCDRVSDKEKKCKL